MKVLTFSRYFPAYHPKKGEQTFFVEKIWKQLWDAEKSCYNPMAGYWERYDDVFPPTYSDHKENIHSHSPKVHTIRAGKRWKVGDLFSPRVWSGKPYQSKQIEFAPPIEIKKVFKFDILNFEGVVCFRIDNEPKGQLHPFNDHLKEVSKNDGLSAIELIQWFNIHPKSIKGEFYGQIICWSESIEY